MKLRAYLRETFDWLKGLDLDPVILSSNKHVRVRITHPRDRALTTTLTLGVSESDHRGAANTRARVNRFLKTESQDGTPKGAFAL